MNAIQLVEHAIKLPMDIVEIQRYIPHRYPFLFIDRVIELEPNVRIVALKNCSAADPLLQGYFPGQPVFPGVLMAEAAAQAATVLGYFSMENGFERVRLGEITKARFRRSIVPGDVVRIEVTATKRRSPFFWFDAVLSVEGEATATMSFSALMQ